MALTCFIVNVIRQIRVKTVIMMALPMVKTLLQKIPVLLMAPSMEMSLKDGLRRLLTIVT